MTTKKPKAGGEIDSWCTKCRLDLGHRIIAMVEGVPRKVECMTCGSHHLYRRPKTDVVSAKTPVAKARATEASGPSSKRSGPSSRGPRSLTKAQMAELQLQQAWEHAIAGQPATAFKAYRVTNTFGAGELVRHSKFGDGVVARVIDRGKVEVLFKDGPRTMAHGLEG